MENNPILKQKRKKQRIYPKRFRLQNSTDKILFVNETGREIPIQLTIPGIAQRYFNIKPGNFQICLCSDEIEYHTSERRLILYFPQITPFEKIDTPRKTLHEEYYFIKKIKEKQVSIKYLKNLLYETLNLNLIKNIQTIDTPDHTQIQLCTSLCLIKDVKDLNKFQSDWEDELTAIDPMAMAISYIFD